MATILDDILTRTRADVKAREAAVPLSELKHRTGMMSAEPVRDFVGSLRGHRPLALIAEVKRASPSAGPIAAGADPVAVAEQYEEAGASCISVLTDGPFFQGSLDDLRAVRAAVAPPVLRKDFIVSEYQLYEARLARADAVLLIAECLTPEELSRLWKATGIWGMHCLIEVYDAENLPRVVELAKISPHRTAVGVNNRDLRTFAVDLSHSLTLRERVPRGVAFVSESGVKTREDVDRLAAGGVDAVLVGETLMRAADVAAKVRELVG